MQSYEHRLRKGKKFNYFITDIPYHVENLGLLENEEEGLIIMVLLHCYQF